MRYLIITKELMRTMIILILVLAFIPMTCCFIPFNKKNEELKNIAKIESQNKLGWFHEAKFGLFIHWGIYSIPAGEWDGKKIEGSEWIQYIANIPCNQYDQLARQFNPAKFNAKEWVSLAKQAGMKYIVITTKHHDGFCMYDSKLTDFDIVDATPYGKDPMKELAEECKKQGLTMCFYYSVKDWHHPDYPVKYTHFSKKQPEGFHGFPNPKADYQRYLTYMEGQVKELLKNYGPIGIIWFDFSSGAFGPNEIQNRKRAQELVDSIHKWNPGCLINSRLGRIGADYGTPEQVIPDEKRSTAFEVCMTLNDNWGYNKHDNNWKSAKDVIFKLCDIVSKGGNYLLNVGPTSEGLIPEKSQEILKEVGKWLSVNEEAIYSAASGGPSIINNTDIKMITAKSGTLYLHVFKWPNDKKIYLRDFTNKIEKIYLLADKKRESLKTDILSKALMIHLPENPIDSIDNIVVVKYID
jgi:alpha-L-fucosidase